MSAANGAVTLLAYLGSVGLAQALVPTWQQGNASLRLEADDTQILLIAVVRSVFLCTCIPYEGPQLSECRSAVAVLVPALLHYVENRVRAFGRAVWTLARNHTVI
jgi:hypothetical protein